MKYIKLQILIITMLILIVSSTRIGYYNSAPAYELIGDNIPYPSQWLLTEISEDPLMALAKIATDN
jgi:hypothetical protein